MLGWIILFAVVLQAPSGPNAGGTPPSGMSLRITSPLGRSGVPGTIRIVAQIRTENGEGPGPVRFFVDGKLLQTYTGGPPYAVDWTDENPFERREIAVAASDPLGHEVRDVVVLEPFDIIEESEVTSVLVEASVQDKDGHFVKNLPQEAFSLLEDGVAQTLDLARHESVGAMFALLIDSSSSMSRRLEFVQRAASTLADYMTPLDRMIVAPFSKSLLSTTGPTNDRQTIKEAIAAIRSNGGTSILDSLVQLSRSLPESSGRRAVILITDGYDENSVTPPDAVLDVVKEERVTVYVVAIGGVAGVSLKGERVLRRLAEETGGRMFLPARDDQLELVQTALAADVQNRYLLTYTPANQKHDGKWRQITLNCADPGYHVKARSGYFAPKPAPVKGSIEFTATDTTDNYFDVSADDLEVYEDGVLQHVDSFQEASQPVSIVLALDASGSMRKAEAEVITSARAFTAALRPQDQLAVLLSSDAPAFIHDLSTNRDTSREAIDSYKASGGTALYDAIADALARLERSEGRRAVVVMTDGRDEDNPGTGPGSIRKLPEVLELLKSSGATVFAIGLGSKVDTHVLQQLADLSGGRTFIPQDVSQLGGEFQHVIEDLGRRYVIGYTSTNGEHDGKWRKVEIRIKSAPQAAVRSVGGYTAPER
jgi:Ca-activated chloride channel family protein